MTRPGRPASPHPAGNLPRGADQSPRGWIFAALLAAVLAVYWPSLGGDFLWDDAGHVTAPDLQSWSGLARIWFEPGATQQYYPLLHSAFWLEHHLWGEAAPGYRLVNVLWHVTSAWLLIALLRRLAVPGALFAGFVFALHPVAVESVAWITEQKNTLSTVFYLLAALAWLRFEDDRTPQHYARASLWFLAALLTKSVTATLPAALMVLAWWRRGRLSWRDDTRPLLPWLAAGIGAGLVTVWFEQTGIGAQGGEFALGPVEHGLLAGRLVWFYAGTLVWPANLAFFYPRWTIEAGAAWSYLFPAAALLLVGILAWWSRRQRGPLAATLLFGGTLFPALGFVNVYPFVFSYAADHFQYLASLGAFAAAAAGGTILARTVASKVTWLRPRVAAVVVLGVLGLLTWKQAGHYVDNVTLYRATLERNPGSWVAHHNLATELAARGEHEAALVHARRAHEAKPDSPEVLNTLANALVHAGQPEAASPLVVRARQLQPKYALAENTHGLALIALGRRDEAIPRFERAISLQPNLAEAHFNLGLARAEQGKFAEATTAFARTVQLRPDHAAAELNWGLALAVLGRWPEARPHFERAVTIEPDSGALHQAYGRALLTASLPDDAIARFREALRLEPALPGLHHDLATALQQVGRTDEARAHAREAAARGEPMMVPGGIRKP
jgi:Flp pilus assembly protein TadD